MNADDFKIYLQSHRRMVERALRQVVPPFKPARLRAAMRYSLLAGGKRLRPLLLIASAESCGTKAIQVLAAACAFECLHTYSLIHDDLPAMDNDDLRRGQPTCHKVFDQATAILAGDALQALAFQLMAKQKLGGREAIRLLAEAAGALGMVGGQMADIQAEGRRISKAQLRLIHTRKTSALIRAAVECGAVLAGASRGKRRLLAEFGRHIGLAFQVSDDILNVEGDSRKLGKQTGSDEARSKATYPALFGLEKSKQIAWMARQRSEACLRGLGKAAEPLRALARFVIERDH